MKMDIVRKTLEAHRNPGLAGPMEAYLRNHFSFLGIKSPERKVLTKEIFRKTGMTKEPFDEEFVMSLWEQPEREFQYVALDYLGKVLKKLNKEHIGLLEVLITTKSWWDTVDLLASTSVGSVVLHANELIPEVMDDWASHENMWLRRTALLFQLKYKQKTDEGLLYRYILLNADSKEFFIQKAIGWALREYSKTNHDSVKEFISTNTLMPLSVREGSKYLT